MNKNKTILLASLIVALGLGFYGVTNVSANEGIGASENGLEKHRVFVGLNVQKDFKLSRLAEFLGISTADLKEMIADDMTFEEILESQNLTKEDFRKYLNSFKIDKIERLNQMLENGKITQEKYDEIMNRMAEREAWQEVMFLALDSNDYNAFLNAIAGSPHAEEMTPEIFDVLVDIHELKQSGDFKEARQLMKESGVMPYKFHSLNKPLRNN